MPCHGNTVITILFDCKAVAQAHELEVELIPFVYSMRAKGYRINVEPSGPADFKFGYDISLKEWENKLQMKFDLVSPQSRCSSQAILYTNNTRETRTILLTRSSCNVYRT